MANLSNDDMISIIPYHYATNQSNLFLISLLAILGFSSIFINSFFIAINILKKEIRKDYFFFLGALAIYNILYTINVSVFQPLVIVFDLNEDSTLCIVTGTSLTWFGSCSICLQPILSMHRYVLIFHPHLQQTLFCTRNKILYLTVTSFAALMFSLSLWWFGVMGRLNGTICNVNLEKASFWHLAYCNLVILICYTVSSFCVYKIWRLLKQHKNTVRTGEIRSRLQDATEIIRLIILELTIPLMLEFPALIYALLLTKGVTRYQMLFVSFLGLFVMHATTDPIVAICVIKPYRNTVKRFWRKLIGNASTIEPAADNAVSEMSVRQRELAFAKAIDISRA